MPEGRFYIETLGCPKNLVDSEQLKHSLKEAGLEEASCPEEAEYLLINTCTFIKEAKEESIEKIFSIASAKSSAQRLIVFGCMVQRYRDVLRAEMPEVDAFFGLQEREAIFRYLGLKTPPNGSYDYEPETFPYAYLKIAEGCKRSCTFCVIPSVRGPLKSQSPESILRRAEYLISKGYKELILVAQDITSYGTDLNKGYGLNELIKDLSAISGDFWLRLLYLYPTAINDTLLETIATNEKICPYIDMPLQHVNKRILRLMSRTGNYEYYKEIIQRSRSLIDGLFLRTTFIVGFPTEKEEEFSEILEFTREIKFDHMGAFLYSDEEGTRAYNLRPKISEKTKNTRYERLMSLQAEISSEKLRGFIGRRLSVLIDRVDGDIAIGRHRGQAPEIDGVVLIRQGGNLSEGQIVEVFIEDTTTYDLIGRPW